MLFCQVDYLLIIQDICPNSKLEELEYKEWNLKKELWNIDDSITDLKNQEVNTEIIMNYLEHFNNTYQNLENGEKRILIENLVKEVKIKGDKYIRLKLHIPLQEFRVFIPQFVPQGANNRIFFILILLYDLKLYYNNKPRKGILSAPYSKKKFII